MDKLVGLLLFLFVTAVAVAFGLIPEAVMYFSWNLIQPTTELGKIAMLALFFIGGGGLCFFFAVLAFMFWAATVPAIVKEFF